MGEVIKLPEENKGNGAREACGLIFGQPDNPDCDKGDWFLMQLWGEGFKVVPVEDESLTATLFAAIAHGDEKHRAWLKQAIKDHFAGKPVQRP